MGWKETKKCMDKNEKQSLKKSLTFNVFSFVDTEGL